MPDPIRILIVDDHPVVRTGIEGMLARQEEFLIVGEAENGEQAVQLATDLRPDVVLMDLRMPLMDGLQAMLLIRERHPQAQVLILTTYDRDRDVLAALNAGAVGYLLKDAPREELYQAVRAAAQGRSVLHPSVAARLINHIRSAPSADQLSEREVEILHLVSEGRTNKEIGSLLYISAATVKTHLIHIFSKLGVPDRAAAVRVALERGILHLNDGRE
ncbi:MAG: response regulator transcription factor [Anaerolineae bacterium]